VLNQFVVSFVDMQLTWYRNMIYLGLLLGTMSILEILDQEKGDLETSNKFFN